MNKVLQSMYLSNKIIQFMPRDDIERHQLDPEKSLIDNIDKILWGTYGKNHEHGLKYVKLVDCTDDHLQNILDTQKWIPTWMEAAIQYIIKHKSKAAPEELFDMEK